MILDVTALDETDFISSNTSFLEDPQIHLPINMLHSVLGELKLLGNSLKLQIMLVFFPLMIAE